MFWNGAPVGAVKKGDRISFDIKADGEISFESSFRKGALRVRAGRVTNIKIEREPPRARAAALRDGLPAARRHAQG
jgi:glutamate-1-semialdehyde aminotransferase